jgi:hypothetical protein
MPAALVLPRRAALRVGVCAVRLAVGARRRDVQDALHADGADVAGALRVAVAHLERRVDARGGRGVDRGTVAVATHTHTHSHTYTSPNKVCIFFFSTLQCQLNINKQQAASGSSSTGRNSIEPSPHRRTQQLRQLLAHDLVERRVRLRVGDRRSNVAAFLPRQRRRLGRGARKGRAGQGAQQERGRAHRKKERKKEKKKKKRKKERKKEREVFFFFFFFFLFFFFFFFFFPHPKKNSKKKKKKKKKGKERKKKKSDWSSGSPLYGIGYDCIVFFFFFFEQLAFLNFLIFF